MRGLLARILEAPLVIADPFAPLDAIVVLGATLRRPASPAPEAILGSAAVPPSASWRPSRVLAERIAAAAALYHAGGAPLVVATGGVTGGASRAEADAIADGLVLHGVPRAHVLTETGSLRTADNARLTAQLLAPLRARRVWIVTQPFHGRRAARLFRRAGLEPHVWHIADSLQYRDRRRALGWIAREYAAWARSLLRD